MSNNIYNNLYHFDNGIVVQVDNGNTKTKQIQRTRNVCRSKSIQTKSEKISSPSKLFHGAPFSYFPETCVSRRFYSNLTSKSRSHLIFIDLHKAFDAIDHKILIEKMKCMDFSNCVTKWFECYLSNRMFSVHVENGFSEKAFVICEVPQGSILGPLLFLIYVNDMVQAVNCDLLLYADDTGLIFQHKDINITEHQLNRNFSNICN